MSDATVQNTPPKKGIIATPLSWLGKIAATLIGSLFFSLLVEWLGMAFFWPEMGVEHSHLMMNQELNWFSDNIVRSLLIAHPAEQLENILRQTYQWLFINTGFMPWLEQHRVNYQSDAHHWAYWLGVYLQATVYVVLTFVLRVFLLLLTTPLFALAILTGFVDGLVRRDIRRFGCGYESGFVYHHAKRSIGPLFFLPWIIYLSLPFTVHPNLILLPAALLLGLSVSVTTGSFKKYL